MWYLEVMKEQVIEKYLLCNTSHNKGTNMYIEIEMPQANTIDIFRGADATRYESHISKL